MTETEIKVPSYIIVTDLAEHIPNPRVLVGLIDVWLDIHRPNTIFPAHPQADLDTRVAAKLKEAVHLYFPGPDWDKVETQV